jgi:hypothetical protein
MIADFVDRRGGGLLMLGGAALVRRRRLRRHAGGRRAAADDRSETRARRSRRARALKVSPTRAGQAHAATQIAATESASAARWNELPQVTSVNAPLQPKPAPRCSSTARMNSGRDARRAGVAAVRARQGDRVLTQDSWNWQMHASFRSRTQTHENFWRQMMRWLVDGVPSTVDSRDQTDRSTRASR